MDRIIHLSEEVHAFAGSAERTGVQVESSSVKARKHSCRSIHDLMRKYRMYGDGFYYVPVGQWPDGADEIDLDNVKWISAADAFEQSRPKAEPAEA